MEFSPEEGGQCQVEPFALSERDGGMVESERVNFSILRGRNRGGQNCKVKSWYNTNEEGRVM